MDNGAIKLDNLDGSPIKEAVNESKLKTYKERRGEIIKINMLGFAITNWGVKEERGKQNEETENKVDGMVFASTQFEPVTRFFTPRPVRMEAHEGQINENNGGKWINKNYPEEEEEEEKD